jgi:putative membrane protein
MTSWHWHPSVVLGLEGLLVLYLAAIGPVRRRFAWGPPAPPRQMTAFAAGVLVLAIALLGPLAEWAEHRALSAHMVQHLLVLFAVPVLWLAGTPAWLARPILAAPGLRRIGYWLTRPVVALGLASGVQIVWHFPGPFGAALATESVHALEHLTLLGTALLLWWPVAGPFPEWPRPSPPAQLLYLFLATIPMMAIAAPITLAESPLYPFYAAGAGRWPLAPQADQELAGVLMWVGGMLGYLLAGTVVYFRWAMREGGEEEPGVTVELAERPQHG